jgi:hypothetical protein
MQRGACCSMCQIAALSVSNLLVTTLVCVYLKKLTNAYLKEQVHPQATHSVTHIGESCENVKGQQGARRKNFRYLFLFCQYTTTGYDRLTSKVRQQHCCSKRGSLKTWNTQSIHLGIWRRISSKLYVLLTVHHSISV